LATPHLVLHSMRVLARTFPGTLRHADMGVDQPSGASYACGVLLQSSL